MLITSLIYRFRIYFVLYQVVVALPFVLSVHISGAYDSIVSALSVINFSVTDSEVSSYSFGSNFDFIDKLYFQTVYPMVVVALICITCGLNLVFKKKEESLLSKNEHNKSRQIISKYIYVALFFIELILPYTSAIIFSTFSCKNIDPDSMEAGDDSFMTADYSDS